MARRLAPTHPAAKSAHPPPPPTATEVRAKLREIFGARVELDLTPGSGAILTGDFNGDGSEDLAVSVRAAPGERKELENPYANWILEDPAEVVSPDNLPLDQSPPVPPPVRLKRGNRLLAIIHGHGPGGWRDRYAVQTYLLDNHDARSCLIHGRLKEASRLFEQACKVRPDDCQSPSLLANTYDGLGAPPAAVEAAHRGGYVRRVAFALQHCKRFLRFEQQSTRNLDWRNREAIAISPDLSGSRSGKFGYHQRR